MSLHASKRDDFEQLILELKRMLEVVTPNDVDLKAYILVEEGILFLLFSSFFSSSFSC